MVGMFSFAVSCCSHIDARIGTVFPRLATVFPSHKNRLTVAYDSGYFWGASMGKNEIMRKESREGGQFPRCQRQPKMVACSRINVRIEHCGDASQPRFAKCSEFFILYIKG